MVETFFGTKLLLRFLADDSSAVASVLKPFEQPVVLCTNFMPKSAAATA